MEITQYTDWLVNQGAKANVEVVYNRETDTDYIESKKPDVAIMATGVNPFQPPCPVWSWPFPNRMLSWLRRLGFRR